MKQNSKDKMKEFDKEQYFSMITFWDNEISRFYSRQNLYISIQLAAFSGIITLFDKLSEKIILFRFALCLITFSSLITSLIATRGLSMQKMIIKIIQELEERSNDKLDISKIANKCSKLNFLTNFKYSLIFSWGLTAFWVIVFIIIEQKLK
jgi:hypothetical protein